MSGFPARVPIAKRLLPHFINPANTFMPNLSFPALHAACHLPQVFAAAKSLPPISAGVGGPSDIKEQTQINAKNIKELPKLLLLANKKEDSSNQHGYIRNYTTEIRH